MSEPQNEQAPAPTPPASSAVQPLEAAPVQADPWPYPKLGETFWKSADKPSETR